MQKEFGIISRVFQSRKKSKALENFRYIQDSSRDFTFSSSTELNERIMESVKEGTEILFDAYCMYKKYSKPQQEILRLQDCFEIALSECVDIYDFIDDYQEFLTK